MGIHKRHLNHHEDGDEGTLSPSYRSLGLPSPRRKHAQSHWEWFYGACGRLLMLVVRKRIITLAALGTVLLVLILRRGNRLWCSLVKSKRKVLADEEGFQFPYQPYQSTHLDEEAFRRDVNTCATSFKLSQVGLLFLTHGRIPNEGTWKHWFSLAQDQVSIPHSVLHDCLRGSKSVSIGTDDVSKRCELNHKTDNVIDRQYLFDVWVHLGKDIDDAVYEGSIFKSKLIPRSKRVEARWGSHSLIDATRVLFAAALTNPFVTKLTLVSESDVPLYGPSLVYSQLLSESKSRINACNTTKHWDRNQYRLRYDFQEAGITWEIWRKSWQWIALTRGHASVVVRDTQIDAIFRKLCRPRWDHDWCDFRVCYSDEHYISTLLAIRGLDNETDCRGELTDRDWSRVKSTDAHPYQYRRKDITKELFHNLRHPEMVGCERSDFIQETVSQEFVNLSILREEGRDVKQSMCDWPQLNTVSSFSPLGSHCPLLARKFANETADMIETLAPFIFAHVSDDSPPLLGLFENNPEYFSLVSVNEGQGSPSLLNSSIPQSNLTDTIANGTLPTNGSDVSFNSTIGSNSTLSNETNPWYSPSPLLNQTVDYNSTLPGNTTDNTTTVPSPLIEDDASSPPIEGGAGNQPCSGMVYDGYLSNCNIFLDLNSNGRRELDESFGVASNGQFTFLAPITNLTGYIVRMEPSIASLGIQISPGDSSCHDISTLLPEHLPLAAKAPEICSEDSAIILSPLSTLLTMPDVSPQALENALSLPQNSRIGFVDNLRSALDGNQTGLFILKREMQVKNIVSQMSRSITLLESAYSKVTAAAFESLSRAIIPPLSIPQASGLTNTRRLLYQSQARLYDSSTVLSAMFTDIFQTLAADPDISVTDLSFPEESTQTAIIISISNMNVMLENYTTSVEDIYKVAIIIQKDVLPSIVNLVNGTITTDDFNQANSFENLVKALNETSLPEGSIRDPLGDSSPPPGPSPSPSSSLKLGLGLGLGLGLPLTACVAYYIVMAKKKKRVVETSTNISKEGPTSSHSLTASPSYNAV